jgi:hypothetical protein
MRDAHRADRTFRDGGAPTPCPAEHYRCPRTRPLAFPRGAEEGSGVRGKLLCVSDGHLAPRPEFAVGTSEAGFAS